MASLKSYARSMLRGDCLQISRGLQQMQCAQKWVEIVLHRDASMQTQLVVTLPDVVVPVHRHLRCESMDIALAGSGNIDVWPRWRDFDLKHFDAPLAAQMLPIPKGAWHGGKSGPHGAAWLSFQRWDGEPDFISADWEAM